MSDDEELYLHDRGLDALPAGLSARLRVLDLAGNPALGALPEELGGLGHLEFLYARDCGLGALPRSIGRLATLRYLNVSENALDALPDALSALPALVELRADRNRLTTIPVLPYVRELHLRGNRISDVPPTIREMRRLQHLDLRENQLASLPAWLGELPLVKLDLRWNGLRRDEATVRALEANGVLVYV